MNERVQQAAEIIWEYMHLNDSPGGADCMVVLGSRDERVAEYAAGLALTYRYKTIVISGGDVHHSDLLQTVWKGRTEAEHFAMVMRRSLNQKLLLENRAENTGQNARYSYTLLAEMGIRPRTILLVTKPYMERRAKATFEAQWPDQDARFSVLSRPSSLREYANEDHSLDTTLHIMVGDLQRIIEYPKLGYQRAQEVPAAMMGAFETLKTAGYTEHLLSQ